MSLSRITKDKAFVGCVCGNENECSFDDFSIILPGNIICPLCPACKNAMTTLVCRPLNEGIPDSRNKQRVIANQTLMKRLVDQKKIKSFTPGEVFTEENIDPAMYNMASNEEEINVPLNSILYGRKKIKDN